MPFKDIYSTFTPLEGGCRANNVFLCLSSYLG